MICISWVQAAQFNPLTLLRWVNILDHSTVATKIIEIWFEASNSCPPWLADLSESDQLKFQHGLHRAVANFSISDIVSSDHASIEDVCIRLFVARSLLQCTTSVHDKESMWSQVVPDVSVLCQVLDQLTTKLVQVLDTKTDINKDGSYNEDILIFLCLELLRLATINTTASTNTLEEGSRRILVNAIKSLLSNVVTPDDLLEGCITALKELCSISDTGRSGGVAVEIVPVIDELSEITASSDNELFHIHSSIRIVSLITLVLENLDASESLPKEVVQCFVKHVQPAICHKNVLLRQASVRTWGLLGLMMPTASESLHANDYTSTLLNLASNEVEDIEIRIQAMFALTDWFMIHFRGEHTINIMKGSLFDSLCLQIDTLFQNGSSYSQGTICCAAEMVTKILVITIMNATISIDEGYQDKCRSWLARLVLLYFDQENFEIGDNDVHQVGNPVRLQQLLSLFFPALTAGIPSLWSSRCLLDSISPLLNLLLLQHQNQKVDSHRRTKSLTPATLVWTRSIDFIVSTVVASREILAKQSTKQISANSANDSTENPSESSSSPDDDADEPATISSPSLVASLQVASFLFEQCLTLSAALRRVLCKVIANMSIDLDISKEFWEDLFRFKELLEELVENDVINDATCRRTLAPVLELLVDVEPDACDDSDADGDDVTSLSNTLGKVAIETKGDENCSYGNATLKEKLVDCRRTRRLRPSN
jgi:condensin complex subunit 3